MKNQFSIKFPSSLSNKSSYLMSSPPPIYRERKIISSPSLLSSPPPLWKIDTVIFVKLNKPIYLSNSKLSLSIKPPISMLEIK